MRTKGDLCGITVKEETTYGVIPSGTGSYAGTTLTLSDTGERTYEEIATCGKRNRSGAFYTGISAGYKATFNIVRNQGWEAWVERAVGSLSGVTRTTPSFDTAIRVAPDETLLWTGCRVSNLTLTASQIGGKIEFSSEVMARWRTMTPFKDADGDTLTMDTVAIPAGIPVTYNTVWEYGFGSTWTKIPGKSWTLGISTELSAEPGVTDDGVQLEAGEGSSPQDTSITLDITITSKDSTWDELRMAGSTGMSFRTTIDGKTVTLTGCILEYTMPDRSQGTYDETISVTASDITVS